MKQVEFFLFRFSDPLQKKKKTEVEIKDNRYSAPPPPKKKKILNQTKIWALT